MKRHLFGNSGITIDEEPDVNPTVLRTLVGFNWSLNIITGKFSILSFYVFVPQGGTNYRVKYFGKELIAWR